MTISKPIGTKAEYKDALREIDKLPDAREGSPEADKLELLSMLVEAYEERDHPIGRADPI